VVLDRNIGTDLEMMGSGEIVGSEYFKIAPTPQQIAVMIAKVQDVRRVRGLEPKTILMPHVFGTCPFYDNGFVLSK